MSTVRDRTPPERARPERLRRIITHYQRELPVVRARAETLLRAIAVAPGCSGRAALLARHGAVGLRTGTIEWARVSELLAQPALVAFCGFCNEPSEHSAQRTCGLERVLGECRASGRGGAA